MLPFCLLSVAMPLPLLLVPSLVMRWRRQLSLDLMEPGTPVAFA